MFVGLPARLGELRVERESLAEGSVVDAALMLAAPLLADRS